MITRYTDRFNFQIHNSYNWLPSLRFESMFCYLSAIERTTMTTTDPSCF